MQLLRQFGVAVLLLVSCVAPAMACMVPDAQMTVQERACCRMMKYQCAQMEMPASHGCCQKAPQNARLSVLYTKTVKLHPVAVTAFWLTVPELLNPVSQDNLNARNTLHRSPPSVSLLRI